MDYTFETKLIEFHNKSYKIILQDENGPCALVALVNLFILSPQYTSHSKELTKLVQDCKTVQLHDILEALADIAIKITTQDQNDKVDDIDKLLLMLPELHKGLNVNPKFNGGFGNNDQGTNELFDIFRVRLVHGWVMDPSYNDICNISYEEAQDILMRENDSKGESKDTDDMKTEIIQNFFNDNPTQLTTFGLSYLNETISDNEFTILFRNDHFSTLFKSNGILYTLVTDIGFKKYKEIVWQSLVTIDGSDNRFFDGNFNESQVEVTATTKNDISSNRSNSQDYHNTVIENHMQLKEDERYALHLQEKEDRRIAKELSRKQQKPHERSHPKSNNNKNIKMPSQSKQQPFNKQPKRTHTPKSHNGCTIV